VPLNPELQPFSRRIAAYWHRERNFGDQLTQCLLGRLGVQAFYASPGEAKAVGVGSILERVPSSFGGTVLGAGLMYEDSYRRFPHARFLSVRGRLTADRCGLRSVMLGDLGLTVRHLFRKMPPIRRQLAVIPHYVDQRHPLVNAIYAQNPDDVVVVDVNSGPRHVLESIASSQCVISSSLHGLIAAQALGKSVAWVRLSDKVYGNGFKFRDHFSAIGAPCQSLEVHASLALSSILRQLTPASAQWKERGDELFHALVEWVGRIPAG
jgi:pyruvyltransferase